MIELPEQPSREEFSDDVDEPVKVQTKKEEPEGFKESLSLRLPSSLEITMHSSTASFEHLVELGLFLIHELNDKNNEKHPVGVS